MTTRSRLPAQRVAEHLLGLPAPVRFRGVEVVDAQVERVADQVFLAGPQAARTEGDIGDGEFRSAEGDVAAHPVGGVARLAACRAGFGAGGQSGGQRAGFQKIAFWMS